MNRIKNIVLLNRYKKLMPKFIGSLLLLTVFLTVGWGDLAFAQFKKYESRTRFKNEDKESQDKEEAKTLIDSAKEQAKEVPSSKKSKTTKAKKVAAAAAVGAGAGAGAAAASAIPQDLDTDEAGAINMDDDIDSFNGGSIPGVDVGPLTSGAGGAGGGKGKEFVNLNPETAFGPEVVTSFNFPDTDILELTKHMQKLTGINLIMDKDIKGKISIVASGPITVGDAWKAYLTALNTNGYALVKSGAFYQIVQTRDIRYIPTKIYTGSYTPNTENYVMKIMPLRFVASKEITSSFRPFMSRYGRIHEIKQTNTILIQDTGSNINRLTKLIKFIDVPGHEESLQIIKVNNSSAQEIAGLLEKILKTGNDGFRRPGSNSGGGYKIIAEPRTNTIIAMTNNEGAKQLRALIAKLDVRQDSKGGGQIHVYYLKHSDAETLSKTLSTLVTSASSQARSPSRFGGMSSAGDSRPLFSSEVKVTADKANNAIVVMASPTDYLTVRNIISQLDIARDQVYVEGLIMDTKISTGHEFGVNLIGAYGSGATQMFGTAPNGASGVADLLTGNFTSLSGMFVGLGIGGSKTINIGGKDVKVNTVNGLIRAIANDSNTNVLATPQILALDNEEAVFEVGEKVPTLVRETTASGSSTSVKQETVTLKLKITPQINKQSRVVKMKIDFKIDDFSERSVGSKDGVGTYTRQAVTTVLVRDKDTVAMGGLMRDKKTEKETKVPLLGDIPVLGWLFKSKESSTEKINMLFFLTPRILAPYESEAAATTKNMLERRESHLGKIYQEDPFNSTVKGLYKKAEAQEKGPLFKTPEALPETIDEKTSSVKDKDKDNSGHPETPDYENIIKEVATTKGQKPAEGTTTIPGGSLPKAGGGGEATSSINPQDNGMNEAPAEISEPPAVYEPAPEPEMPMDNGGDVGGGE